MFSRFFIHRPIFATVLSLVIIIAGLVTMVGLPVSQYPDITPPTVRVSTVYPGASAKVVADTVAQPIEEAVNGVENMVYMSSNSTNSGQYNLTVTFKVGTDLDMATVLVQNRVAQAAASLPEEVQRIGVVTEKQSTSILLFASLYSDDSRYDSLFLSNYIRLRIKDELARLPGVGGLMVFGGAEYSMRVWLDPDLMRARSVTTTDIIHALREQNVQVAAGQLGESPAPNGQAYQLTVNAQGRLSDANQFGDIVVRTSEDGRMLRLKDVARVELGGQTYGIESQLGGIPAPAIGVLQQPGSNALEVVQAVRERMEELSRDFPEGVHYKIPFDTTRFVDAAIHEVVLTILIAVALVFFVILLFLQDWRATIIPAAAIPVSLIGTFAVMAALGVSINMMSMFGIVLAIGIVVDDAIVVVENVVRNIDESGLNPVAATERAMGEVTGPIVATTLVLLAVFVPTAFLGGITGRLYRQFALTISVSTVFSAINALTLSPALSALMLRPNHSRKLPRWATWFNTVFGKIEHAYGRTVQTVIRRGALVSLVYLGLLAAGIWGYRSLPANFVPPEDQGYAMLSLQLPDGASTERTAAVVDKINQRLQQMPGVDTWVSVVGYSLLDDAESSNSAAAWIIFKPWEERLPRGLDMNTLVGMMYGAVADIQEANIFAFPPPAIFGLGNVGGFQMELQDRGGIGLSGLQKAAFDLSMHANKSGRVQRVYSTFRANVPQLFADVDRNQTKQYHVPLTDVYDTLQANLGSVYVNDFNRFGRTYQVRVQADADARSDVDDLRRMEVRNTEGKMVPLGSLVTLRQTVGAPLVRRYNMYPSASVFGSAMTGQSSGEALSTMEQFVRDVLPNTVGFEWTGMSYQEKLAGGQTAFTFLLAVLFIYLVLAAQYESWSIPFVIVLSVPLALLGTVLAVAVSGLGVTVYTRIGIVLLIAMAAKTAILIAEFAKDNHENGMGIVEAVTHAAKTRYRPILMTAFTFILGVTPLIVASGAGSGSRRALGSAVFGGMISATVLLVIFVPVFYVLVQKGTERLRNRFRGETE